MILVGLYLSAWIIYYFYAQTDSEFNIPYHPTRVFKINLILLGQLWGWMTYLPMFLSYLHWRYWIVGSRRFKEIAR